VGDNRQMRTAGRTVRGALFAHRPWDGSTRSSDVNEPQINVDHFHHRPTYRVVGLLTEQSEVPALSRELARAGVDVAAVEILCG
jgi:hypothetical protein